MGRRLAAVPDQPRRVVLYERVSALMGRGGEDFHSPDVQRAAMQRATMGMRQVGEVVSDIDRSGRNFAREGIDKIRKMAEARQIDAVAVYDVSRLGRNVRESLVFLNWLADRGVQIISACEQVDTSTPAGRLMLTNMLAIAEYRSDEIGRSWSATIARRQARGQHHGTIPQGYMRSGGRLRVDPILGPVIKQAWADYAAGVSIRRITGDIAAARGRAMSPTNVKQMFRRQVYRGHIEVRGEVVTPDAHEALVDDVTWDAVQRRLLRDAGTPSRNLEKTWALVGLAYCPAEHRLSRQPRRTPDGVVERLICGMYAASRTVGGCPGIGAPRMDLIEEKVLDDVRDHIRLLRTDDAARAEQLARTASAVVDEKSLQRRLNQVTDAIAKMAKAWALDQLTNDEYAPVAELRAEADTIRTQLAAVTPAKDRPTPEQLATAGETLVALWPDATPEERNRMLRLVVDRVVVRRAARWREPVADCVDVQFL